MKIATAFSGGLAACEFALRYEDIDHEVIFACEWDKYARKQYLEFHGEPKTFYNDISDLDAHKYKGEIDLFVWGSPCQDLSLAGKRKGFDGEKSSLFREGARVLNEMKPKAFIFENVKGLLSSNGGADYKEVIKTFQDLGYLIASKVLNAKEHGTAQNRERVFVVGFLDVLSYHDFNFEEAKPLTKVLKDYLEVDVEEKFYLKEKTIKSFTSGKSVFKERFEIKDINVTNYANCLDTREPKSRRTSTFFYRNGKVSYTTPRECFRLQGIKDEDINLINSDTQSYKIAGNAIEVNTMRSIIRQLYKAEKPKDTLF